MATVLRVSQLIRFEDDDEAMRCMYCLNAPSAPEQSTVVLQEIMDCPVEITNIRAEKFKQVNRTIFGGMEGTFMR